MYRWVLCGIDRGIRNLWWKLSFKIVIPPSRNKLAFKPVQPFDGHSEKNSTSVVRIRVYGKCCSVLKEMTNLVLLLTAELMLEFFKFFMDFPFTNNVLCGCSGEVIPKESFQPPEDGFRFRYITLQDPFDLAHNIAKTVSLQTFVSFCEHVNNECTIFAGRALDLRIMLEKDRPEEDLPAPPVMVSVSGFKASLPTTAWIPKVPDLTKKILEDFFQCEFVKEMDEEESGES